MKMRVICRSFPAAAALAAAIFFNAAGASAQVETPGSKLSDAFAEIAKKIEPAVVSIDTKTRVAESQTPAPPSGNSDDILEFFRRQSRRPSYGVGSGFLVDRTGYILTNAHVIRDAAKITVTLENGDEFPAQIVGSDNETDLAVLKIDAGRDLPVAALGNSDNARVGEWVLAIGSPFGLARTVTAGIVSQVDRDTPSTTVFQRFIQTDAAINRGNSGGPLVNLNGEVIGINSQIATTTGDYNGVGFALPSNEALNVYQQIVKSGRVKRGFLGVALESVRPEFGKVYGVPDLKGAIITEVRDPAGAAAKAGLQAGDVVVKFKGAPVTSAQDLIAKVSAATPNEAVDVELYRETGSDFRKRSVSIVLSERPIASLASDTEQGSATRLSVDPVKEDPRPFGLTLEDLTPTLAATYKLEGQKGTLIKEIDPQSFIADVRSSNGNGTALGSGDLIQRINRDSVANTSAFVAAAAKLKKGDPVVLHVLTYNPQTEKPIMKIVQFTIQ